MKDFIIRSLQLAVILFGFWYLLNYTKDEQIKHNKQIKKVYSESKDTILLACLMYSECSICPIGEKLLTGSVVLNRMKDGRWGCNMLEVLFASGQFKGTQGYNWTTDSYHMQLARFLMTFGSINETPLYFLDKQKDKNLLRKLKIFSKEKYHTFAYE